MLGHAIQDYAGMKRRSFDRCEEFVLGRALQVPSQGDAAQVGVHQHGAIAVIPGHAQQAGLPGAILLQARA